MTLKLIINLKILKLQILENHYLEFECKILNKAGSVGEVGTERETETCFQLRVELYFGLKFVNSETESRKKLKLKRDLF